MSDQTQVAKDLAQAIVNQSGALMNALEEFGSIIDWGGDAGIVFTDYEAEIAGNAGLNHAEGAHYNKVGGTIIPGLIAWLEAQTISNGVLNGKTYKQVLQMTRRS